MADWVIALISIAVSALISGVVGYIVKRTLDRYFKRKDDDERLNQARAEELEALRDERVRQQRREDIREIVKEEIQSLSDKVDVLTDKVTKNEEGTLASLRNDILTCYYRCREKGYRGNWDFENIHHLYDAYIKLNGNSFIEDIIRRFDDLPPKEDVIDKETNEKTTKKKILVEDKK